MASYQVLFSIEVLHAYYPGGVCPDLRFTPSDDTAQWLARAGCLVRPAERGLMVLFDAERTDALRALAAPPDGPLQAHWGVRCGDPLFGNCTEAAASTPRPLLVLAADRDDAERRDPAGQPAPLPADRITRPADLARLASPWLSPVLGPRERRLPPDFTVSLLLGPHDLAAAMQAPRRYRCRLQARATVWKYCFVGDWVDNGAPAIQVVDLAQACGFGPPHDEPLPDGRTALAVRSTTRIPLQQRSDRRFQLRQRSGDTDKVLIKRLPVASARQLSRETVGGEPTLVSEIYVHR